MHDIVGAARQLVIPRSSHCFLTMWFVIVFVLSVLKPRSTAQMPFVQYREQEVHRKWILEQLALL